VGWQSWRTDNRYDIRMEKIIVVHNASIRTDWIHLIQRGKEQNVVTCTIWFSVGPVGVRVFKGAEAETALKLLAEHPGLKN
jgi:hypothetical protein